MILTQHAEQRSQQRHIASEQLEWLLSYGEVGHNRGVCLYFFDRAGFSQLLRDIEPERHLVAQRSRNIYAVIEEGNVITMGYRDERLKPQKPHKRIRRGVPTHNAARRIHHRIH